ncbi:glycosyltransferase family 2 protein [Paenibacillus ginsengarvi]|uniref:Glycosyltransferase family 2 protein n=1 Tax=Paenibacillus ginsengarvi TaxID=400777 RepID=A0A3B0C7Y8_9BACL|nr:glycosyltransferase family 2 protein [Paenibacillus ginsengarvi]RKN82175.1 glycosyltransferase family 2 protein [Paenibacillus ginsengarvi]
MDLSIVIVNYKTMQLTLNCLESIYQSRLKYEFETVVIDNDSKDDTLSAIKMLHSKVIVIANNENSGFSKANNQGIHIAKGRYILLLNSDTTVEPDTLETMIRFMDEHPKVGASGCKVVLPDGSLDKACRRGFPTPLTTFYYVSGLAKLFPKSPHFNSYHMEYLSEDESYPIDCLVGAFMMVRREAIEQVGLLDESFFMYFEDTDWCYRIQEAGWINYYYPKTQITHYKRGSSRGRPFRIAYEFHRAMKLFYDKHYRKKYPFWVTILMYVGIGAKFGLTVLKDQLWKASKHLRSSKRKSHEHSKGISPGQ